MTAESLSVRKNIIHKTAIHGEVQKMKHWSLIQAWKEDNGGAYQSWFLWEERIKNFRSIRRGLQAVVQEIRDDKFGNAYRGSSLETVVHSIAEQRQIFKGADHAFLWKPKLRIPDIYENRQNQIAFGKFLDVCLCCQSEEEIVSAIIELDCKKIKGLGPANANLLYFLHPTVVPPTNTAIIKGYNLLTGANVKLGKWDEYMAMRQGMRALNVTYRTLLSNDLGAVAGLLFDIGSGRYGVAESKEGRLNWENDLAIVRDENAAGQKMLALARENDHTHTEVQGWLRDLGKSLGYDVWIASNDKSRVYQGDRLGQGCLAELPPALQQHKGASLISLIDVLWLAKGENKITAAFEVEHSTSIYSGIVRMLDLALGFPEHGNASFFLVAPDTREKEVRAQFARPAFSRVSDLDVRYLGYDSLKSNKEAIGRFGSGLKGVIAISSELASHVAKI